MADDFYQDADDQATVSHSATQSAPKGVAAGSFNLGVNESGNFRDGVWDLPAPATASEADGSISLAGIIKVAQTGYQADDGNRYSDAGLPRHGGNDGTELDHIVGTNDAQRGNSSTGMGK